MKKELSKFKKYISRGWDDERVKPPKYLRALPPFFIEVIAYLIILSILIKLSIFVWSIN
jgi:hypothetical protein